MPGTRAYAGSSLVDPSHATKLYLWLGLHQSARRRQLAAARALFHAYGGAYAAYASRSSAEAGAAPPDASTPAQRREMGTIAGVSKCLNRCFTDLVRPILHLSD